MGRDSKNKSPKKDKKKHHSRHQGEEPKSKKHKSSHKNRDRESNGHVLPVESPVRVTRSMSSSSTEGIFFSPDKFSSQSSSFETSSSHRSNDRNRQDSKKSPTKSLVKQEEEGKKFKDKKRKNDSKTPLVIKQEDSEDMDEMQKQILKDIDSSLSGGYDDMFAPPPLPSYETLKMNKNQTVHRLDVTSKKGRTAVFAGTSRSSRYTKVPSLERLCLDLLSDNLDNITCVGDAPYYLLKPVLEKCTPVQLQKIESYNQYNFTFLLDADELWKQHCRSEFKFMDREDEETWRSCYMRAKKEREDKLNAIARQIKKKTEKEKEPVRKTVAINAIAAKSRSNTSFMSLDSSGSSWSKRSQMSGDPIPSSAAALKAAASKNRLAAVKPAKKAPLMAKTLAMIKASKHMRR